MEVVLERPAYDLIIFRVRYARCTLKIYTKGERVLRIEAMAHNARDFACGTSMVRFPQVIATLQCMVERLVEVIDCVDTAFIDSGVLDALPTPARLGQARVGGIDINKPRMRAVLQGTLPLALRPAGFTTSDLVEQVQAQLPAMRYTSTQAAYDLRKLRAKDFVSKLPGSRRYLASAPGIRGVAALLVLREHVLRPLLAGSARTQSTRAPTHLCVADRHYRALRQEMQGLFRLTGIAA